MKKAAKQLLFLGALLTIASCSSGQVDNSSPTSSSQIPVEEKVQYFLTGNIDLNDKSVVELTKEGTTYTYSNVTLRRGNSFLVYSNKASLSYDNLAAHDGFKEGLNGYINVLNEGIYDVIVDASLESAKLTLTKKSSSYNSVKLHVGDQSYDFTLNDDFSYQLNDVNLLFREKFYISLDDEKLSFDDYDYNDLYYNALRFEDESVQVVQKGDFNFKLDFKNENALIVSSDNVKLPQITPSSVNDYEALVNSLEKQFVESGSSLSIKEETYLEETKETSNVYYKQRINLNEHYYEEVRGDEEDAVKVKRANIITDKNFYEITEYENSTTKPLINGYILGEPEAATEEEESTIVRVDKNYITLDKATDKMIGMVGKDSFIRSALGNAYKVTHLYDSEHNSTSDKLYYENANITSSYISNVGDAMSVKATNMEKYVRSSGMASKAIYNEISFTTDNDGYLKEGKYVVTYYEGNIFDEDENLLSDVVATKKITYTFSYEYNERVALEKFDLDINDLLVDEFYLTDEIVVTAGNTINKSNIPVVSFDPETAINSGDLQIVEFDSDYLKQGVGDKTTYTARKQGETIVKVGLPYSNKEYEVYVVIEYADPTSVSISPSPSSSSAYYVGSTYTYTATISSSYADPAVKVESSNEDVVEVTHVDSLETQRKNGKAEFSIKILKESTSSVTITITSVAKASVKTSFTIKNISKALTLEDFVGTYYYSSYSVKIPWELSIDNKGQANLVDTNNTDVSYSFKVKVEGSNLVLDSSDEVKTFEAKGDYYNKTAGIKSLKISAMTLNDDTDVIKTVANNTYTTSLSLYEVASFFDTYNNMTDASSGATLKVAKIEYGSSGSHTITYQVNDGEDVWTFTVSQSTSSNNGIGSPGSLARNNTTVYGTITFSNLTDNSCTLHFYKNYGDTFDVTFNFTK